MITNIEKYKKDLKELIANGEQLLMAVQADFLGEDFRDHLKKVLKDGKRFLNI